jgi:hypothetical protein
MKNEKGLVRCSCGTVTRGLINFDRCSSCEFPLVEAWGAKEVPGAGYQPAPGGGQNRIS